MSLSQRSIKVMVLILFVGLSSALGTFSVLKWKGDLEVQEQTRTALLNQTLAVELQQFLHHLFFQAQTMAFTALQRFQNSEWQKTFLEEQIQSQPGLLGLRIHRSRHSSIAGSRFEPVLYLRRPITDPYRINAKEWDRIEINIEKVFDELSDSSENKKVFRTGNLADGTRVLRLFSVLRQNPGQDFKEIVEILLLQEIFGQFFDQFSGPQKTSPHYFHFLVNPQGELLLQSNPQHFSFGENLSHLPLLREALAERKTEVSTRYSELPNTPELWAQLHTLKPFNLLFVTQVPVSEFQNRWPSTVVQVLLALAIGAFTLFLAFGTGSPVYKITKVTKIAQAPWARKAFSMVLKVVQSQDSLENPLENPEEAKKQKKAA